MNRQSLPTLVTTSCPNLKLINHGKVRDMYEIPGHPDMLLMVATDRISAYDIVMDDPIPGKGNILTSMSLFWFELLDDIVENHFIAMGTHWYPDACHQYSEQLEGRSMLINKVTPLPIECIVRGYISGSMWKAYQETTVMNGIEGPYKKVLGHILPANMQKSEAFPKPIFTPSTKAEAGEHDQNLSPIQAIYHLDRWLEKTTGKSQQDIADYFFTEAERLSLELYEKAAEYAYTKGIIIADTKFEFGVDDTGELVLIDEVLTPDSSRFWPLAEYVVGQDQPSFDKQFLRDYLSTLVKDGKWDKKAPPPPLPLEIIEKTHEKYKEALRLLTT